MVERRRVMDERIDNIATKVDYMCGKFDATLDKIEKIANDHSSHKRETDHKISGLKSWQDNANGRIWGLGVGMPVVVVWVGKLLGFIG